MHLRVSFSLLPIALFAAAVSLPSRGESPDDVLAETSLVKITRADYDAAIANIPGALRDEFATSRSRLTMMLNNILTKKTLAAQAKQAGLQPDPEVSSNFPDDVEAALAVAQLRAIEQAAADDFDARRNSLVGAARENYRLAKDQYQRPEEIKISAIQISTQGRGKDAALALARSTREKLVSGFDFAALARQLSEDKASAAEGGQLPWATAEEMNPTLAKAAFAMPRIGDISEPVLIGASYILIRLDDRHPATPIPFDDVKDEILGKMREDFIKDKREQKLEAVRSDPTMKVNQRAVDALVRRIDPELMKPPTAPSPSHQQSPLLTAPVQK